MTESLLIAKSAGLPVNLLSGMANRHGLITGVTGTGKIVTLQKLAEIAVNDGILGGLKDSFRQHRPARRQARRHSAERGEKRDASGHQPDYSRRAGQHYGWQKALNRWIRRDGKPLVARSLVSHNSSAPAKGD